MRARNFVHAIAPAFVAIFVAACSSTTPLPRFEPPLAKTDFQTVRTTAYTHTESDHLQYGKRNALGGELRAAAPPYRSAAVEVRRAQPPDDGDRPAVLQPFAMEPRRETRRVVYESPRYSLPRASRYGSAAADWSRWPAGTVFRLLSTGQVYQVDDYGWALAGRNTIDLYMPTRAEMNRWGVRPEQIQILQWGDADESLRLLAPHQGYRHIRRMVLELEGKDRAAATME